MARLENNGIDAQIQKNILVRFENLLRLLKSLFDNTTPL